MPLQVEPKFLASFETKLADGGIKTYGRNDPLRLFAWIIGNTVDVRLGGKTITIDTDSLRAFLDRQGLLEKGKTLSPNDLATKLKDFLNEKKKVRDVAEMDFHASSKQVQDLKDNMIKFEAEYTDIFTGPKKVFDDVIKSLKSLPKEIADASEKIKKDTYKFFVDAGNSAPVKQLNDDLKTIGADLEQFIDQEITRRIQPHVSKFITACQKRLDSIQKPSKPAPKEAQKEEQVSVKRDEVPIIELRRRGIQAGHEAAAKGAKRMEEYQEKYAEIAKRYDAKTAAKEPVSFEKYSAIVKGVREDKALRDSLGEWLGRKSPDNRALDRLLQANVAKMEPEAFKVHVQEFVTLITKGYNQIPDELGVPPKLEKLIRDLNALLR